MNTVLITGASGQLGSSLINEITEGGQFKVLFPSRDEFLKSKPQMLDYIEKNRPDTIINCAAFTNVDLAEIEMEECALVNVNLVENLAEVCSSRFIRLIQMSTDYVFDGLSEDLYSTDSATNPLNYYGRTKEISEAIVLADKSNSNCVVRTSWLYSERTENFVTKIATSALNNKIVEVVDDQFGHPTFTQDLSTWLIQLVLRSDLNGIFHASNLGVTSWNELAKYIYSSFSRDENMVRPISTKSLNRAALRPRHVAFDFGKNSILGLENLPHWHSGIDNFVEYFGKKGNHVG